LLHQRLTVGWRGRKAAIMAIAGFGAALFTFLGVNLLLPGLHSYANW
jgi:ABC-type transport system involved in cytochrome c biogenesis permease subunit